MSNPMTLLAAPKTQRMALQNESKIKRKTHFMQRLFEVMMKSKQYENIC